MRVLKAKFIAQKKYKNSLLRCEFCFVEEKCDKAIKKTCHKTFTDIINYINNTVEIK